MPGVRPLADQDLPQAQKIVRTAFGTFLGAPDLDNFWTDFDYVYGRHGAEHVASFAADDEKGHLAGVNFATRWAASGSLGRCPCDRTSGTKAWRPRWSRLSATSSSAGA